MQKSFLGPALFLTLAVAAVLAPPHLAWIRLAGWVCIAYRVLKQPQDGLWLVAFFSPLFDGFGVVPIGFHLMPVAVPSSADQHALSSVFFSLKPVQIILLLLIASVSARKRLFFKDPLDWLVVGSLIGLWMISLFAGSQSADPLKAFRVSLNFALLIVFCKVLMSMIEEPETFWRLLRAYFIGVVFLSLVHVANYFCGCAWFGQETRFNNHFGFLLSMSFPLGLCLLFTQHNLWRRAAYGGMLLLMAFCTVLTLSRSSIYGSIIGMALFLAVLGARSGAEQRRLVARGALLIAAAVGLAVLVYENLPGITDATSLFHGKLSSFFKLFDWAYWRHSIFVDPNGGMFGERFVQLRLVKQIFLEHWLFGEGWTNRVISFHGLMYTMLTGTGIAGFSLFGFFLYKLFLVLWKMPHRVTDPAMRMLGIALFCALLDWMLHSLMDTYFLQFHIWLILAMALSYIKLMRRIASPGPA